MDSRLGRKMSICCSHLCAMPQAFNLWHICDWCHPQKRSSKPINGHKTIFSLDCTLMLLVSKLPIELNHSTKWKWYRICVKKNQNLQKENMVSTWVWLKMTSDNIFASINLLSCRILETGTISFFLQKPTHTVLQLLKLSVGSSLYLQSTDWWSLQIQRRRCVSCSHLETLNFCAAWWKIWNQERQKKTPRESIVSYLYFSWRGNFPCSVNFSWDLQGFWALQALHPMVRGAGLFVGLEIVFSGLCVCFLYIHKLLKPLPSSLKHERGREGILLGELVKGTATDQSILKHQLK